MEKSDCKLGMPVTFGRPNGQQAVAKIHKINPKKAQVELTEQWNSNSPGTVFIVPYSSLKALDKDGKVIEPKRKPITYHPLNNYDDTCIIKAIDYIYGCLSPENLTCDGELAPSAVRQRSKELHGRLRHLFAALGTEIDECEASDYVQAEREDQKKRAS